MTATKKALVIFGRSKYNLHVYAAKRASEILTEAGYTVTYVNTAATDDPYILQSFMQSECPDYAVTFDCSGFDLELLGDDIFLNSLCCPMAHVLFNGPVDFAGYLDKRMNFVMDFYMQYGSDIQFAKKYFPRIPDIKKFDFSTGICIEDLNNKDIDILIPSTYCPPSAIMEQIKQMPPVFANICNELVNGCIEAPGSDIYNMMTDKLTGLGVQASREDIISLMTLTGPVMNYVKMYFVDKIVHGLLDCGLNITVCGEGWNDFYHDGHGTLRNIGPVEFADIPEVIGRAKIVINNQAHKSGGIHERVWLSIENNAVCISDVVPVNKNDNVIQYSSVDRIPDIAKKVLEKY